jgi:hypothetical protein
MFADVLQVNCPNYGEEQGSMKLNERLKELINHEIVVNNSYDAGEIKIPAVILEEVGEDYLIVITEYNENTQYHPTNERRFINISNVVQIVHKTECKKCTK